jgi:type I restriction enzyme R subunit
VVQRAVPRLETLGVRAQRRDRERGYNIAHKVRVIIEHFRDTVMGLLNGQAKAMVVTGSRKEAVRYTVCRRSSFAAEAL